MATEVSPASMGETSRLHAANTPSSWTHDLRRVRIYRFSIGVTVSAGIAFGGNWPLFFITPVFVAFMLALPLPGPTLRQMFANILLFLVTFGLGLLFTLFLLPYPLLFLTAMALVLFHSYYLANRGGPLLLVIMTILAVLLLPILGLTHDVLSSGVAHYFLRSAILAIVLVWLAHSLIPDPPSKHAPTAKKGGTTGYSPAAAILALKSTLAILPLVVVFVTFNWSGQLLVLIFAALFSLSPEVAKGRAAASKSMISTLIGGATAFLFYSLLIVVPEFYFFLALMGLATLIYANGIFSDDSYAAYLPSAFIALLVLIGGSMGENASLVDKFVARVVLMSLATLYVVLALRFANWLIDRYGSTLAPPPG